MLLNRAEHSAQADSGLTNGVFQAEPALPTNAPMHGRKRRHTELRNGVDIDTPNVESPEKQRKSRPKTYGTSSGRGKWSQSQASDTVFEKGNQAQQPEEYSSNATVAMTWPHNRDYLMQPPSMVPSHFVEDEDEGPRQRNRPRRVLSLMEESVSDPAREISRSRSSMGNYESLNIDFRGTGGVVNVTSNPFGSLSQTSVDDEASSADQDKTTAASGSSSLNTSALLRNSVLDLRGNCEDSGQFGAGAYDVCAISNQMPGGPKSIDPNLVYNDLPNDTQLLSSSKPSVHSGKKRARTTSIQSRSSVDPDVISINGSNLEHVPTVQAKGKKRGRRPKEQRRPSYSPMSVHEERLKPNSDELAIGLPKEQYKPRPSRSRGGTNELPQKATTPETENVKSNDDNREEQSSPVKHSTSEPHLSEETFVGLPKENYKPRPSRSRSEKTVAEPDEPTQTEIVVGDKKQPTSSAVMAFETPPIKKPKKTPKKTKVKRAKTSATLLLKKTQEMLSEGEEDVMWFETQPAKVKLELPPGLDLKRAIKDEQPETTACNTSNGAAAKTVNTEVMTRDQRSDVGPPEGIGTATLEVRANDNDDRVKRTDTSHIAVAIPAPPVHLAQAEPKKRGRKKRSVEALGQQLHEVIGPVSEASDVEAEPISAPINVHVEKAEPKKRGRKKKATVVTVDDEEDTLHEQTVLEVEKGEATYKDSTGTRAVLAEKDSNLPTPNYATLRETSSAPIDATSPKQKKDGNGISANSAETPQRLHSSNDKDSEKGPSKHSPINPSGGRARYRVGLSKRTSIPPLLKINHRKEPARDKENAKGKGRAVPVYGNKDGEELPKYDTSYVEWD